MKFFEKLERKFGRYAVNNLMLYLMIFYVGGFVLNRFAPEFYWQYLCLDAAAICRGQLWRIVTYMMYPPHTNILWFLFLCFIYYSLGKSLERLWGTFYFNLYVLIGLFANVLASMLIYLIWRVRLPLTADNLYMSFLLALAMTVPDMQFYLYMILPIKAKYLGIFYGLLLAFQAVSAMSGGNWISVIEIVCSVLNFILFFAVIKRPVQRFKQAARRASYQAKVQKTVLQTKHRCAVCGRTEKDDPNLEFRFCSKCEGEYEYCMEHLYTHVHVTKDNPPS